MESRLFKVHRTKRHAEIFEKYPVFQGADWKRLQVLAAQESLLGELARDCAQVPDLGDSGLQIAHACIIPSQWRPIDFEAPAPAAGLTPQG